MSLSRWTFLALTLGMIAAGLAAAEPGGPPGRGGHHPPGPPPPEALQACSGVQSGAACTFQHDGHTVTGTCRPGPRGEAAACMPDRPPPPPEAVDACAQQPEGGACAFTDPEGRQVSGTCRAGPQGMPAACVPSGAR